MWQKSFLDELKKLAEHKQDTVKNIRVDKQVRTVANKNEGAIMRGIVGDTLALGNLFTGGN